VAVALVGVVAIYSFPGSAVSTTSTVTGATSTGPGAIGLSPVYIWQIGSPTNLTEAELSANYTVAVPTSLPSTAYLAGVRSSQDGGLVVLGYAIEGVAPILNNSEGWSLIVTEQWASTNPILTTTVTTTEAPATTVVSYSNGTQVTSMGTSSTIVEYPPPTITVDGQTAVYSALTATNPAFLGWDHGGVSYYIFGNVSLQELEQVATSMISP
jgi:hypothetical protein